MNINYDTDIIYDIDVDFYSRNHFDTVYAKQYDENNRWIRATVWKNGEVYTIPTNAIAVFTCTKRDGNGIYNECQIVNNQILYPISLQTTILDGNINAEFRLYSTIDNGDGTNTSKLLSSPKFKMHIEESALKDDTVISSSEFNALTAAMNNVGDLTTDVNNAIARANTAISNAETATLNANTATTNANNATSLANTATTNANNAADLANTKANLADTATTNANTATANAITATNNANTATTNANNAATNANNKAGLANTAATNANNVATQLETETLKIFKPAVSTYADLSTTYPTPENGWTVTVNGENPVVSYRYNGTEWVNLGVISSVDKATNTTLGIIKGGDNVNIDVDGVISVPDLYNANKETVGYGVLYNSGLEVTAQATPNMTVSVSSGTAYMPSGKRYTVAANTSLAINTADATNPRKDIVYVDSNGLISYLAGTASATPIAPSLPSGGILLAEINVVANATSISQSNITDRRTIIKSNTDLVGAVNENKGRIDTLNTDIGDKALLNTVDKTSLVNAINENTLQLEDLAYNVKSFGAIGDGVADDTQAINDAISATNDNGGIVYFPHGKYRVTNKITINSLITIQGEGFSPDADGAGTIIFCDFDTAVGDSVFYVTHSGVTIRDLEFLFNQPAIQTGWVPNNTPWCVYAYRAPYATTGGNHINIINVMLRNPSHGIKLLGLQRAYLNQIYGQPLSVGIDIDYIVDVARFTDIHFWAFWSGDETVFNYQKTNCTAFKCGRLDNPYFNNIFTFNIKTVFYFYQSENGYSERINMTNIGCDACHYGILINGQTNLYVNNFYAYPFNDVLDSENGSRGIYVMDITEGVVNIMLNNADFEKSTLEAIYMGDGNTLIFNNINIRSYNVGNFSKQAIFSNNGIVKVGNYIATNGNGQPIFGGNGYYSNASQVDQLFPSVGLNNTFGQQVKTLSKTNGGMKTSIVKIIVSNVSVDEIITVRIIPIFNDNSVFVINKTYTENGDFYLDAKDITNFYKDNLYVKEIAVDVSTNKDITSSGVIVFTFCDRE